MNDLIFEKKYSESIVLDLLQRKRAWNIDLVLLYSSTVDEMMSYAVRSNCLTCFSRSACICRSTLDVRIALLWYSVLRR